MFVQPFQRLIQRLSHRPARRRTKSKLSVTQPETLETRALLSASSIVTGDFNGDGFEDTAVGSPREDVRESGLSTTGVVRDAGSVTIMYGGGGDGFSLSRSQQLHQGLRRVPERAEAGDLFGHALAVGDFNNDGIDDLAVGAPGDQIGRQDNAGSVTVFSGSNRGLRQRGQLIRQSDADISGTSEAGDLFGWSLAAGNLDGQGGDDLAIGAPGEDSRLGRVKAQDVGVVHVLTSLPIDASGLSELTGAPYGLNGVDLVDYGAASGDSFGFSLAIGNFNNDGAMDLAVGSPGADVSHNGYLREGAGRVDVFYGNVAFNVMLSDGQQLTQPSMYNPGFLERFGWSLAAGNFDGQFGDDLAIGVPGENIVNPGLAIEAAGAVNIAWSTAVGPGVTAISPSNMAFLHQNVEGLDSNAVALTDPAERGDRFGYSLATGHFDGDDRADLMVGVPFEDLSINGTDYQDAGQVHIFMDDVLTGNLSGTVFTANQGNLALGLPQTGDQFGMVVVAADVNNDGADDYLVGTPGEGQLNAGGPSNPVPSDEIAGAGAININYGNNAASPQMWHQDSVSNGIEVSDEAEHDDGFGGHLLDDVFADLFPSMYSLTL